MKLYEYDGVIYNLDQLVSLAEGEGDGTDAWTGKRSLLLTFSGVTRPVAVPLTERERVEKLIREHERQ